MVALFLFEFSGGQQGCFKLVIGCSKGTAVRKPMTMAATFIHFPANRKQ